MNAYISYICNDNYLPGLIALIKSLKYNKCINNILIMVTKNVSLKSKEVISKLGALVKNIEEIHYKGSKSNEIIDRYGINNTSWMMFTKLNIWKQCEYKKLLYIDADTVVLKNIDHLFTIKENFSAVPGYSKSLNYYGIEGGVLLIKPCLDTYNGLIQAMNSDRYDLTMSDQSLINDYFNKHGKINLLDNKYNTLQKKHENIRKAYIYHWNGKKPWNESAIVHYNVWKFFYSLTND